MVVTRSRVTFLPFVVMVLLVAGNHSLSPQQQATKNDCQAEEVHISLLVNQLAVLRLLNDSSTISSWHERELREMRDLRLELEVKTRELKMDFLSMTNELQNITAASLDDINTKEEELQIMTAGSLQEMNTKKGEWQSMTAASLQEMNTKKEQWQSITAAALLEMNTKKGEWQRITAASLQEMNTKKEELQRMTAASLDEINRKMEELQSMTAASLNEINRKTEEAKQDLKKAALNASLEQGLKDGWSEYQSSYYKLSDESLNYAQATEACRAHGGYLASIGSEGENSFLVGIAEDHTYIGLSDNEEEGVFTWQDGSPFIYSKWRSGEPNDYKGKEDCVEIYHGYPTWNDVPCDRDYHYICEKEFH